MEGAQWDGTLWKGHSGTGHYGRGAVGRDTMDGVRRLSALLPRYWLLISPAVWHPGASGNLSPTAHAAAPPAVPGDYDGVVGGSSYSVAH